MCNVSGRFDWQRMPLGATVKCRGWSWRVCRVESGTGAIAIGVRPDAPGAPGVSTFLWPFDRVTPRATTVRWRPASRHRVSHLIAALDGSWPDVPLAAIAASTPAPWPHQLVPVLALTQGLGARALIADDVGLGKTLAAGLAIAELVARDLAASVLVLTPSGLRDQWRAALQEQLQIEADVVDARVFTDLAREVPADCSPWTGRGCRILSYDFAKQPAVLRSLAQAAWDVLVIDEAHAVAGDSQRAAAVRALAVQSRFVVMLTATPHNGDALSFRKLVSLGAHTARDPLVWIRRGRADIGLRQAQKNRTWYLQPTPAEQELHRMLLAYAARVDRGERPEARLVMIVLKKRALSGPDALLNSLRRRLACLSGAQPVTTTGRLPFDDGETDDEDDLEAVSLSARGLADLDDELWTLRSLIERAERACQAPAKYRALERVVRRTAESAIVFTEYRDTLEVVAARLAALTPVAVLHGGLDRIARREAVGQFTTGRARVLVATDAAAEGLNLHARCRFVVHVDLPWSPTTLAQRAGRVDRIGQTRRVRIWHLAGAGRHEEAVVAALARRFQRIQRDLGGSPLHDWADSLPVPVAAPTGDPDAHRIDAGHFSESAADLGRVSSAIRRLRADAASKGRSSQRNPRGVPWLRSRRARTTVGAGVVFLFTGFPRRRCEARTHVAVHVSLSQIPREPPRTWLHWLMARAAERAIVAIPSANRLRACAEARERELLVRSEVEQRRLRGRWQPSLFDERAARAIDVARDRIDRRTSTHAQRLAELTDAADAPVVEPVFALIVG